MEYNRERELLTKVADHAHHLRHLEPAAELVYASITYHEHALPKVALVAGVEPLLRAMAAYDLRLDPGADLVVDLVLCAASAGPALISGGILDDVLCTGSEATGMPPAGEVPALVKVARDQVRQWAAPCTNGPHAPGETCGPVCLHWTTDLPAAMRPPTGSQRR